MSILLCDDWQLKVSGWAKIYLLDEKDREIVNKTLNELHWQGRIEWTKMNTLFSFLVFIVWKLLLNEEKKERAVVDIQGLNQLMILNAYFLLLQFNIIAAVRGFRFIIMIDCVLFFYHWKVRLEDWHHLTIVSHQGQETFKVAVIGFKNSPVYIQKQINWILCSHWFAKAFVNDVVIFSSSLIKHASDLHMIFSLFTQINISIKASKAFLGYLSVQLLEQKIDLLGLSTFKDKLVTILKLNFPWTLCQLKTYLSMTGWLR